VAVCPDVQLARRSGATFCTPTMSARLEVMDDVPTSMCDLGWVDCSGSVEIAEPPPTFFSERFSPLSYAGLMMVGGMPICAVAVPSMRVVRCARSACPRRRTTPIRGRRAVGVQPRVGLVRGAYPRSRCCPGRSPGVPAAGCLPSSNAPRYLRLSPGLPVRSENA
jgi:hypothetical protein